MIVFNYIQIIKDNIYDITWENFENKLYQVVISENDLLNQFDNEKNFRRINKILKRENITKPESSPKLNCILNFQIF